MVLKEGALLPTHLDIKTRFIIESNFKFYKYYEINKRVCVPRQKHLKNMILIKVKPQIGSYSYS